MCFSFGGIESEMERERGNGSEKVTNLRQIFWAVIGDLSAKNIVDFLSMEPLIGFLSAEGLIGLLFTEKTSLRRLLLSHYP